MKDINDRIPKPIADIIENSRKIIFDFEYPTPARIEKDVFKKWFETTFLQKYAVWEIGFDTYELFKLQLQYKLNVVMPIYNIKIDNLTRLTEIDDSKLYEIKKGTVSTVAHKTENGTNNSTGNNLENSTTDESGSNKSKTIESSLPANMISADDIGQVNYADNSSMKEDVNIVNKTVQNTKEHSNNSTNNLVNDSNSDTLYDLQNGNYIDSMEKMFELINKNNMNIYEKLFAEFKTLFLGLL